LAPDTAKPIKLKILAIEQSIHSLRQQMSDKINDLKLGARERDAKIVEFENKLLAIPKSQDMNFMKQHYAEINRRLDNALTEFATKQEMVAVKAEIIDIQTLLN
jgi:chromosome segregation and condensation protein ScpB